MFLYNVLYIFNKYISILGIKLYELKKYLFIKQVRIQTQPGFVSTLREALPIIYNLEGINGFYKSLVPLWMRQIPYTMMKFACFEKTIELLYKSV